MYENSLRQCIHAFEIFRPLENYRDHADMPVPRSFRLPVDLVFIINCVFFIFSLFLFNVCYYS